MISVEDLHEKSLNNLMIFIEPRDTESYRFNRYYFRHLYRLSFFYLLQILKEKIKLYNSLTYFATSITLYKYCTYAVIKNN